MRGATQVAAGELHTIALTATGVVLSWGDNQRGQCGRHPELPILPTPGRALLPLQEGEVAAHVEAGGYRSAVVTSKGRLLLLGLTEVDLAAAEEEEENQRADLSDDDPIYDSPGVLDDEGGEIGGDHAEAAGAAWWSGRGVAARRGGRKRGRSGEPMVWSSREVERVAE